MLTFPQQTKMLLENKFVLADVVGSSAYFCRHLFTILVFFLMPLFGHMSWIMYLT